MGSKREEERNEKIIRGLMKLPPNRKCINCNSLGPQYVCTNFWTFVCITCSGIHREFTHRVKSVSMAKFTSKEVEALQNGGNQRARDIFLSDWDFQRMRLPDSSKPDRIREFIKSVYIEKRYSGGRSSDKPPRNTQTQKGFEEDHQRASSYHSYSQSPPYDYQYEDRRYGKQSGMLARKPGSERGSLGNFSNLSYSPERQAEQINEDRLSDFSMSSAGDSLKFENQSPNFQKDINSQQVREILVEDGSHSVALKKSQIPNLLHPQRSTSLGSLVLLEGNSMPLRPVNSHGSQEFAVQSLQPSRSLPAESLFSSQPQLSISNQVSRSTAKNTGNEQEIAASSSIPIVDLFAEFPHPSSKSTLEKSSSEPILREVGWANFDMSPLGSVPESSLNIQGDGNQIQKSSEESSLAQDPSIPVHSQWSSMTSGLEFTSQIQKPSEEGSLAQDPATLVHSQWSSMTRFELPSLTATPQIQKPSEGCSLAQDPPKMVHSQWSSVISGFELPSQAATPQIQRPSEASSLAQDPPTTIRSQWSSVISGFEFPSQTATPQIQRPSEASSLSQDPSTSLQSQWNSMTSGFELPSQAAKPQKPSEVNFLAQDLPALVNSQLSSMVSGHEFPPQAATTRSSSEQSPLDTSPLVHNQWISATSVVELPSDTATHQAWNAFGDSFSSLSLSSFDAQLPPHAYPGVAVRQVDMKSQKDIDFDMSQLLIIDNGPVETSFFPPAPSMGINHRESQSTNPFDFLYDSDPEPVKFMDMGTVQAALPLDQFPSPFLSQSWFPQNPMPPFVAPVAHSGSLSFLAGAQPPSQLPDLSAQGPVSSTGGNPFA